jgi:DNA repair photolyase
VNPYRGCEHGCIYCYARPTHEYLGFSPGLDFETKILVKHTAPQLLRETLASTGYEPKSITISGVTDPYQPIERKLRLTRGCLEVCAEFRNPVGIVTKNRLVTRDIDVLQELDRFDAAAVFLSVTTLDVSLNRILEPRTSLPEQRLGAIAELAEAGIPAGVLVAPVIPGLNDSEIPSILEAAASAGARTAGFIVLRLPHGVAPLFESWLDEHMPERKDRILNRVRSVRGGKLNDPRFGSRMSGEGFHADQIEQLFRVACRKRGLNEDRFDLSTAHFRRRPIDGQMDFFDA